MIAVIDVGNTRIKWAIAEGDRLTAVGSAAHAEGLDAAIEALVEALPGGVTKALVASVAGPEVATQLAAALLARCAIHSEFVTPHAEQHGIRCAYAQPSRLGVDRWVAMIAARAMTTGDFCVIQAGTAVTFDAVAGDGRHLGGLIFAGPRLMADALNRSTGRIGPTAPATERPAGLRLLGRSTDEGVGHAAMLAISAALDRAVATVAAATGSAPAVWLTGGDAAALRPWLETDVRTSADLVLAGLARIARNRE